MAQMHINNWRIAGISAVVPSAIVENSDYEYLNSFERKLLMKTTGIERKHVVVDNKTTSDLCEIAANRLLDKLGWDRSEVDLLVFVSQSPDYYLPATSIILQNKLGLKSSCMAFDVGLGCSGYVYGLSIVAGLLSSGGLRKALLLVGDVSSSTVSENDKSTYPLFGDAGTATAIEYQEGVGGYFNLQSNGAGYETIIIRDGGLRNKVKPSSFEINEVSKGIKRCALDLELDGLEVYNFSVSEVPNSINEAMDTIKTVPENYDYFVMHQANLLMNESIRKKLKFEKEQTPYSLKNYGNTSSASIPLTICSELNAVMENKSNKMLMSGFGVGLSWATLSIDCSPMVCLPVIEV